MKSTKIYPKDWLQLHPYKQSGPTDLYYTRIANQIYNILVYTKLANSFYKEDIIQVSIRMAAYFEDVISELNIWRSFITEYKRLTGNYLPFYTLNDHYYNDEANYEDVRFLLWHYTQEYHGQKKGTFVNPDNPANEETARLIYQLFCDEWTTAPENDKMQALFAPETTYETTEEYEELLYWFHYNSYLFTDTQKSMGETIKEFWRRNPDSRQNTEAIMMIHHSMAHLDRTVLLAYTSPKWLSLILPDTHPSHTLFVEKANYAENLADTDLDADPERNKTVYSRFKEIADGKLLFYMKSKEEFIDFATRRLNLKEEEEYMPLAGRITSNKFAVYASPKKGLDLIVDGIEYIKDEDNPFYDEKKAADQALSFFIVKHCSMDMLKALEERGMLADAQTNSLISPERGKDIIHGNWQFLAKYFLHEV